MEESKIFQTATLTTNGRPILHPTEIECQLLSAVDLESQSVSTKSNGLLILTTHRLLWIPPDSSSKPLAIPLSSVTQISPLKKSIKSIFHSPRLRFHLLNQTAVTVVFRGKGDFDSFVEKFWQNWRSRSWESADVGSTSSAALSTSVSSGGGGGGGGGLYSSDGSVRMVGVSGILRKEQEMWESTDKSLQDAFQDLNALMSKAKEMVSLAEKMRLKLLSNNNAAQQGGNSADEDVGGSNQEIQDWLLSVGFISPVTKESAGALYHQQLARQLADFVSIPLERAGGMINLIDVYCLFNRARGTELISPEDLLQACSLWQKFDVPVMLRKFDSGVMVIQNKSHSDDEVFSRIKTIVSKTDAFLSGITASDAAMTLGIAPAMAKEHLLNAESKGLLCRDISPDGFRFYINIFPEIDFSNVHWVKQYSIYAEWIKATSSQ